MLARTYAAVQDSCMENDRGYSGKVYGYSVQSTEYYMMVKSRLIPLLNILQSMKLLVQISIYSLESSTSCILVLRYKSCGQRSRARPSCVRKLTATGNCKVEILGYLAVPIWNSCGFIITLEIVLLDPCRNRVLVSFYRSRLSSAISIDSGRTWRHHRTLVASPALGLVGGGALEQGRVEPTVPPAWLLSSGPVPHDLDLIPAEGHSQHRAPRASVVGDTVFVVWWEGLYGRDAGSARGWERLHGRQRLRAVPLAWFYGHGE